LPRSTCSIIFPYTTLFRSSGVQMSFKAYVIRHSDKDVKNFITLTSIPRDLYTPESWQRNDIRSVHVLADTIAFVATTPKRLRDLDRKSTRLNSSHGSISYA